MFGIPTLISIVLAATCVPTTFSKIISGSELKGAPASNSKVSILRVKGAAPPTSSAISYRTGGAVMTNPVKIYHIYIGTWNTAAVDLVNDFTSNLGTSPWYKINTKYYYQAKKTSTKIYVKNQMTLGGSVIDAYSQGTLISDFWKIVKAKLDSKVFPADPDALYNVFTSEEVVVPGFCTQFCGYHNFTNYNGVNIKFSFVGVPSPTTCSSCTPYVEGSTTINGLVNVDAAISTLAHEIVEAVSDPQINAWYDGYGLENADKCSWTFGATSFTSTGAVYNAVVGTKKYLLQRNWDPVLQACANSA